MHLPLAENQMFLGCSPFSCGSDSNLWKRPSWVAEVDSRPKSRSSVCKHRTVCARRFHRIPDKASKEQEGHDSLARGSTKVMRRRQSALNPASAFAHPHQLNRASHLLHSRTSARPSLSKDYSGDSPPTSTLTCASRNPLPLTKIPCIQVPRCHAEHGQ